MPPRPSSAARALRDAAPVFAALGDETRLGIVARLCERGPQSIARLTEGSDVTRQAVTKHLRVLEDAGLVQSKRDGRERHWAIEPDRLEVARRCLDVVAARWDAAIERLRAIVED